MAFGCRLHPGGHDENIDYRGDRTFGTVYGPNGQTTIITRMTPTQLGGLCYVVAAVLFSVWWRLRIEYEIRRDNSPDPENYDE